VKKEGSLSLKQQLKYDFIWNQMNGQHSIPNKNGGIFQITTITETSLLLTHPPLKLAPRTLS
jgi:hypothetical protein